MTPKYIAPRHGVGRTAPDRVRSQRRLARRRRRALAVLTVLALFAFGITRALAG